MLGAPSPPGGSSTRIEVHAAMSRIAAVPLSRRERRALARREQPHRPRSRHPEARPAWRSPFALATLGALAVGLAIVAIAWKPAPSPTRDLVAGPVSYAAELTDGGTLGSAAAPVVMQLYADFQCPACKAFVTLELPKLVTDYVVPGTLRIETHDIDVLGKGSADESLNLAVGAACAAEQDRYWPFHDLVFWNQGRENRGDHDSAFIAAVADRAGLDIASWTACTARSDISRAVKNGTAAARQAGIQYTPTLIVNGQTLVGVPSYTDLSTLIARLAAGGS